jgi:hypothetical protein
MKYDYWPSEKTTHDAEGRLRVRVVCAAGTPLPGGFVAADPPKAQEHRDELGWCEEGVPFPDDPNFTNPKITLDSGSVIWGYECWWHPVLTEEQTHEKPTNAS